MQPLIAERLRDNALSVEVQIARATARTTSGRKKGFVMDNDDGGDGDAGVGGGEHPDDGDGESAEEEGDVDDGSGSSVTAARQRKLDKLAAQRQNQLFVVRHVARCSLVKISPSSDVLV